MKRQEVRGRKLQKVTGEFFLHGGPPWDQAATVGTSDTSRLLLVKGSSPADVRMSSSFLLGYLLTPALKEGDGTRREMEGGKGSERTTRCFLSLTTVQALAGRRGMTFPCT